MDVAIGSHAAYFELVELLYRDHYGVHHPVRRGWQAWLEARTATLRRVWSRAIVALLRPRQVTFEQAFWGVIVVLLALFVVVLITGKTGVARGGR